MNEQAMMPTLGGLSTGRCLTLTERLYQTKKQLESELEKVNDLIKDLEAAPELQKVLDKLQSANIRY